MKLGEDVRAIWVASVPRTGSMWTFNIVRDLVRSAGRQVLPEIVPHADHEMEAIGKAGIAVSDDATYVLKVHTAIAQDLPKSFFIVTRRDFQCVHSVRVWVRVGIRAVVRAWNDVDGTRTPDKSGRLRGARREPLRFLPGHGLHSCRVGEVEVHCNFGR